MCMCKCGSGSAFECANYLTPLSLSHTHTHTQSNCIPELLPEGSASRLQALTLDYNNLGKLSGAIGVFLQLKVLNFNFNMVGSIPQEIGTCTALTDLQFDANEVEELPGPMQKLTNLVRLKLNDNKISNLPDWIGGLTKLQHLSVGNNRLQFIPYPLTYLKLSVLTIDGNPLTAVETGVLMEGPKEVVEYLEYNHNYDIPDRNFVPDPMEQRRQIDAHVNSYAHEVHRMHASRLESEYKQVGGYNAVEIAYNKRVGEDRTEGSGAVILDEEMLRDVQVRVHKRVLLWAFCHGLTFHYRAKEAVGLDLAVVCVIISHDFFGRWLIPRNSLFVCLVTPCLCLDRLSPSATWLVQSYTG